MGFTTNDDFLLGRECAGVVSRVGQKVADLKVGDRVYTLGYGAIRSHYRSKQQLCMKIPDGMTTEVALTFYGLYSYFANLIRMLLALC